MRSSDRVFFGLGAVVVAAAVAAGGYLDRHYRTGVATGDAALGNDAVQESYDEALGVVAANYAGSYEVETVNKAAIQGLLRTLDPHSTFFDTREFSELKNEQQSQLIGIGVTINQRNGRVYVLSALPGTPAEKAGLKYGDAIVAIDGKPTTSWTYPQVVGGVRGELGKSVDMMELSVRSKNCLDSENILTIRELVRLTEQDLLKVRNFGKTSLKEVKNKLALLGLGLGMDVGD